MTDVFTVLVGAIANCIGPENCQKCEYRDIRTKTRCKTMLLRDALELLKAQEPRVLTWEELMALPHGEETNAPVVSEVKYPINTWDEGTLCKWRGAEFIQEFVQDHSLYNRESYGKVWRCWTALPTKKQRKAAKWNA